MSSAIKPTNVARVTMLMSSNLLMNDVRTNSVDLLKVQNQLSSGLKLSRPSDSPPEATTIMHLDSLLERQNQYLKNIDFTLDYLAGTDTALGQAVDLTVQAHDLAVGSIGTATDDDGRQANALIIDQIIEQIISISNNTARGSYLFAGQNSTQPPFEAYASGVLFTGNLSELQTRVADENVVGFSVNGNDTFGSVSSRIYGIADLDPDITADTLLSDLNGYLGQGIRRGSIRISDGTDISTIDLSGCVTMGDVIAKINAEAPAGTTATIGPDGSSLQLTSIVPGANVTVTESGGGYMAQDLGIYDPVGSGATLTGQDVDARLSLTTPVTALAGGAGIDTTSGLQISNSMLDSIPAIDISSATTLGDILSAINNAGVAARAEINAAGTGINVFNLLSGSRMSIGENSGTTATDLGIRSFNTASQLSDFNGGRGVYTEGSVIRITDRQGASYDVDLTGAQTVQDVIDTINNATGWNVVASLTASGNGIELNNAVGGLGNLSVTTVSDNGYFVAQQLGFYTEQGDGMSVASDTVTGEDTNYIMPNGLFSHLIALRDAMLANDDYEIEVAANAIDADRKNLSSMHGMVGSRMIALENRKTHLEDNVLAAQTLRSDIRDIDFTEAITRYQNLYTALQANLTAGSMLSNISLLDFLS